MSSEIYCKDILLISLSKFYLNKSNMEAILPIINGKSNISLRLLDWFVTNYSRKENIVIMQERNDNVYYFNVYLSYRSQLKAYSKNQFDPFRRRNRIQFYYDKNNYIETTIGQLNFFRWILQNDILTYILNNTNIIEKDMVLSQKKNKDKTSNVKKSFVKNMNTFIGFRKIDFS